MMKQRQIGDVLVIDESGKLFGIAFLKYPDSRRTFASSQTYIGDKR